MSLLNLFLLQPKGIRTSSWARKLCVGPSRKASEEAEGQQFPVERAGARSPAGDPRPCSGPPKALWAVLESKPHQGRTASSPQPQIPHGLYKIPGHGREPEPPSLSEEDLFPHSQQRAD